VPYSVSEVVDLSHPTCCNQLASIMCHTLRMTVNQPTLNRSKHLGLLLPRWLPRRWQRCCVTCGTDLPGPRGVDFLQGNGVIVGLGICGVVLSATSSAAVLMGDFRTAYICLAAPRAMFAAQAIGQILGAVLGPYAFMLFFNTGQVRSTPCRAPDIGCPCSVCLLCMFLPCCFLPRYLKPVRAICQPSV